MSRYLRGCKENVSELNWSLDPNHRKHICCEYVVEMIETDTVYQEMEKQKGK